MAALFSRFGEAVAITPEHESLQYTPKSPRSFTPSQKLCNRHWPSSRPFEK